MNKYDIPLDLNKNSAMKFINNRIFDKAVILEFGPANGRLTKYLNQERKCIIDIVEIDEMSGIEAAQYANSSFLGAHKGDIENFYWYEQLKDRRYDFIIFADVLEHLRNAEKVLSKSISLLKSTGAILISIPNIANNAIILQLIRDEFTYTKTGLLDETHIRFFTYNSFNRMVDSLGLYPSYIDAVFGPVGTTEVPVSYNMFQNYNMEVIKKHILGEVYQFVYELRLKNGIQNFRTKNHLQEKIFLNGYICSTAVDFFFDRGQGFHHGDKLLKSVSPKDGIYQVQWEWDDSDKPAIRRLRFDWVDTASSFRLLDVKTNIRGLTIEYPNAKLEQGIYYFYDMDPGIILTGDIPSVGYATITYKMQPLTVTDLVRHSAGQEAALGERERQVQNIQEIAADKEKTIRAQEALTQELRGGITDRDRKIAGMETALAERDESLRAQEALAQELRGEIADRDHKIAGMETAIAERDESLRAQEALDQKLRGEITDRDRKIAGMETALAERDQRISGVENELVGWGERLREQESAVLQLRADVEDRDRQLNDIRSSHAWALMLRLWKVRDLIIPMNSRRRLFAKMAYKTMTSPRVMFSKLTMENIHKLFRYLRTESPADVEARLALHVPSGAPPSEKLVLLPENHEDTGSQEASDPLSGYEAIVFPTFDDVDVSIIIPVYNQFGYTYNCLRSIHEHTRDIRYEVIVADDTSTDVTKDMERIVENAVILHNTENLGFLRNCNHAATKARGKYIFFLNNDTQVQPDWLPPLTKLLDEQPDIGMTGSKLVYPDGHLQEAGGIFWNDGSAWNYGHGGNPDAPEYNYVKDVDYISGAAILIRRTLWEKIGGFDERFIPAYCEDADLAFTVRREGYRVVYQPLSVVVHFEGVSNGRDLTQGIKQYQVENQKKFYEKWKDVLEKEHFPNGQDVFWARDRSRNKKTIVVVDHYVPHFDQDAGSRTTYSYLRLLVRMGFHVVFVGDNFAKLEPYSTVLRQMGIDALVGDGWSMERFRRWLGEYSKYISYVCLNRPHISIKYIDLFKEKTNAKIIYYGHDLHFIREQRQYELEKDPALLSSAQEWKKTECELFSKSDVVYTPGAYEEEILRGMFPQKRIQAIPIYLYTQEELEETKVPGIAGREGLLFVGGFRHLPNEDAVRWFMEEIFPSILRKKPEIQLYIVGSHPTEYIRSLAGDQVIVTGYVSDEELEALYGRCRVVVVPLRYGAGIKGKVVEAMRYGVPMVTTPIGAEGLPDIEHCIAVSAAGDAGHFAQEVMRLLMDNEAWKEQSIREVEYMKRYFTYDKAEEILRSDLE